MNISYKRENHKSYLVVKEIDEQAHEGFPMKMIRENEIGGLLSATQHAFNGEKEFYYDISGKQPLELLYEKRGMDQKDLKNLLKGLSDTIKDLEKYLLDEDSLFLSPESIYISSADGAPYFIYYPEEGAEERAYGLAEYLLEKVSGEEEAAVMSAYEFYRYIKEEKGNLSNALSRLDLKEEKIMENKTEFFEEDMLDQDVMESVAEEQNVYYASGETDLPQKEKVTGYKKYMRNIFFIVLGLGGLGMLFYSTWHYGSDMQTILSKKEFIAGLGICAMAIGGFMLFFLMDHIEKRKEEKAVDEVETIKEYWEGETRESKQWEEQDWNEMAAQKENEETGVFMETVLLQENCYQEERVLTGKVKGKKKQIDLSSFPFFIGKNREQADFVLDDHSVSRLHARFTLRDDVVYLTDLNSTNGTYKNGIRLEPNELTMLEAEDEITFGRLTFTYH